MAVSTVLAVVLIGAPVPSPIDLWVDATDAKRHVFRVWESLPVRPGRMAIRYPKCIPGEHGPTLTVDNVVRFRLRANGRTLPWRRDPLDQYTIRFNVPAGVRRVDVDFVVAGPRGEATSTNLARIIWNRFLFLPEGPIARISVRARLTPPSGWTVQTALPRKADGESITFQTVSAERLVDSPAQIGRYARTFSLGDNHFLDVLAEGRKQLELRPAVLHPFRRLVREAKALCGAKHYRQYRFLTTFSDQGGGGGLEHHESSENGVRESALTTEGGLWDLGELVAHEFFHSWNGKYRRPLGLATTDFAKPFDTELLWIYEGLTEYYGFVLAARSGFVSPEGARDSLAQKAGNMALRSGRRWKSLADTAIAAQTAYRSGPPWQEDRRSYDFYPEGVLVWLEADAIVRRKTKGRRSLDDFCRAFFRGRSGSPKVVPYSLDDVLRGLNAVAPYDWRTFFHSRVYQVRPQAPTEGIELAGWRLRYTDRPNRAVRWIRSLYHAYDHRLALGIVMDGDGNISDVPIDGRAFRAGAAPGMKVVKVGDAPFSHEALDRAIRDQSSVRLTVQLEGVSSEVVIPRGGYPTNPTLERIANYPDLLSSILKPRA